MQAEIKKDWEHSRAPKNSNGKQVYKKGTLVEVNYAEYVSGIEKGYLVDPNAPIVEKPKKEKATSKFDKQTR
jgi:hypothetical protein